MPTDKSLYTTFPTAWGTLGAVAGPRGLTRVVLPCYQPGDLEELLRFEHPEASRDDAPFTAFIEASRAYFNARRADFSAVAVALPGEKTFGGKVYRACRAIPHGQTRSYKDLALAIGQPDAARAVATLMSKNPTPLVVPCHRVIYSDGRPGGFSSPAGPEQKQRLLALESSSN